MSESVNDPMVYLYSKIFTCPVCSKEFVDFLIRKSKLRQLDMDSDFRTRYRDIDPNLYEVLVCGNCGYAALHSFFDRITSKQQDWIKEKVSPNHRYRDFEMPLSPADALTRYKMALACAQAINAKASQKAIICLKMAWVYRDAKDEKSELTLLRFAYNGLKEAFTTETFPLGAMDEPTAKYMIAELARRLGEYDEALRLVSDVVVATGIPGTLKERAQDLKDMIREARGEGVEAEKK